MKTLQKKKAILCTMYATILPQFDFINRNLSPGYHELLVKVCICKGLEFI